MIFRVKTRPELGEKTWDDFVHAHPLGSLYHTSSWHGVIEDTYRLMPEYHVGLDSGGAIRAACPVIGLRNLLLGRRRVSLPFSDYCDPLVQSREELSALLESLRGSMQDVEIRAFRMNLEMEGYNTDNSFSNFLIDLGQDPERLYESLHPSCIRRQIKKAENMGIEIREGRSEADLRSFYRLHLMTRKRLGVPVQPFLFFINLYRRFKENGDFNLLLADFGKRVVGGLVLLGYKPDDTSMARSCLYYKYGASDSEYFNHGVNPLLFWNAILRARDQGYHQLDLGRASIQESGLQRFKKNLGAHQAPLLYYYRAKVLTNVEGSAFTPIAKYVLRKSPAVLNRVAGRIFYRYLG